MLTTLIKCPASNPSRSKCGLDTPANIPNVVNRSWPKPCTKRTLTGTNLLLWVMLNLTKRVWNAWNVLDFFPNSNLCINIWSKPMLMWQVKNWKIWKQNMQNVRFAKIFFEIKKYWGIIWRNILSPSTPVTYPLLCADWFSCWVVFNPVLSKVHSFDYNLKNTFDIFVVNHYGFPHLCSFGIFTACTLVIRMWNEACCCLQ